MTKRSKQLSLPLNTEWGKLASTPLKIASFSHDNVCADVERQAIETEYAHLLEETDEFDRRLVSFQGNKNTILHSWFKYKEGFSAQLVEILIGKFGIQPGDTLLEPFSGSATTLLVSKSLGINAVGIEILPISHLSWDAKACTSDYQIGELKQVYRSIEQIELGKADNEFPHIAITESAFPPQTENDLMYLTQWLENENLSNETQTLLRLLLCSILEEISYTRKDGQYLRWDSRSEKVIGRNHVRSLSGKKPVKGMNKGELPSVKEALLSALHSVIEDIEKLQRVQYPASQQELIKGSALEILPVLDANRFAGVITSPPYCNRYDYTRTYALELAYLGVGEQGIRQLRHSQLSCTVEHRSKLTHLRHYYQQIGALARFQQIFDVLQTNAALREINSALRERWHRGEINNEGVLPMVDGYFTELTFLFGEIFRVCRPGAYVAFVNDNVRYGGEIIPVDTLTTNLAVQLGFEPVTIYVLLQRKGNSSQQMEKFGREPLRKSITIWKKP